MVRHADSSGLRERHRAQPSGDAADLHHIRHYVVGSMRVECVLHVERPPPVFAALDRRCSFTRDQRVSDVVVGKRRFFHPREALTIQHTHSLHRFHRCQGLVVVDHDCHTFANSQFDRADDRNILLHRRVANLGLHAREAALRPIFGDMRGALHAVVTHRAVRGDRLFDSAQKAHERGGVAPRKRIPQRHVDRRQRNADESLRAEQPKPSRELLLDLRRRERLTFHQGLEITDEIGDGRQRHRRVGEHHAVTDDAIVERCVGQHQRRLGDGAACGLVRLAHRHAHRAHAQFAQFR